MACAASRPAAPFPRPGPAGQPLPPADLQYYPPSRPPHPAQVLLASHYHLLTTGEWDIATGENFQLNLPITINWNYMETEMLSKFWCR